MNWFSILKESRQIADVGIKTKLGTRPLTISDNDEDDNCCEKAFEEFSNFLDDNRNYRWHSTRPDVNDKWRKIITDAWEQLIDVGILIPPKKINSSDWNTVKCYDLEKIMEKTYNSYWDLFNDNDFPMTSDSYESCEEIRAIFMRWDECEDNLLEGSGSD